MRDMELIFQVTDDLGIHREQVSVPLEKGGAGAVRRLPDGSLEIVVPNTMPLERWLPTLRQELARLGYE